jgi:hypothetical protein
MNQRSVLKMYFWEYLLWVVIAIIALGIYGWRYLVG